jgi:hypothetical protein
VAIAGGTILRVAVDGMVQLDFGVVGRDVTSLVRDPFLGVVYVSLRDGSVVRLGADGSDAGELVPAGGAPGRLAYGPDGALYYLRTGYPTRPMIERIALPTSR